MAEINGKELVILLNGKPLGECKPWKMVLSEKDLVKFPKTGSIRQLTKKELKNITNLLLLLDGKPIGTEGEIKGECDQYRFEISIKISPKI